MRTFFAKAVPIIEPTEVRGNPHAAAKLVKAVAGSSGRLIRMSEHPFGASVCLALSYMILSSGYIIFSGRLAANTALSIEQLRNLELLKGLAFVLITGAVYFGFAYHLLRRIATQQHHLALIFQTVSDCLFLLKVEDDGCYRFLCVNAAFLKVTGLTRAQVIGKRIEEVLPDTSQALAKRKFQEAVQGGKTVSWEQATTFPVGERVGEVTVTPLTDKMGRIDQLAGATRDITERKQAEQKSEACGHRLQILSRRLVEAQETERRRIACELHDEIGQSLTAAQMNLQAVLQSPCTNAVAVRLMESLAEIENVMEQVHDLSLDLRPSILDDLGLEPALRWYANRQAALAGLQTRFATDTSERRCDPMIETECFRIAQEALTNVVRHAHAHNVTVELHANDGQLHLDVCDDGVGFDVARVREQAVQGASLGLLSMEERATLAGGQLELKSVPGQGTDVHAWFPLESKKADSHEHSSQSHSSNPRR